MPAQTRSSQVNENDPEAEPALQAPPPLTTSTDRTVDQEQPPEQSPAPDPPMLGTPPETLAQSFGSSQIGPATTILSSTQLTNRTPDDIPSKPRRATPRVNQPRSFTGAVRDARGADEWLGRIGIWFQASCVEPDDRTLFAASFLEHPALNWYQKHIPEKFRVRDDTWDEFVVLFRERFESDYSKERARRTLGTMRYRTGDMAAFNDTFRDTWSLFDTTDSSLGKDYYMDAMPQRYRSELRKLKETSTLEGLMRETVSIQYNDEAAADADQPQRRSREPREPTMKEIEARLNAVELRGSRGTYGRGYRGGARRGRGRGSGGQGGQSSSARSPDIECYNCHKRGHISKDCRQGKARDRAA